MNKVCLVAVVLLIVIAESCKSKHLSSAEESQKNLPDRFLVVLGIAQDAGGRRNRRSEAQGRFDRRCDR